MICACRWRSAGGGLVLRSDPSIIPPLSFAQSEEAVAIPACSGVAVDGDPVEVTGDARLLSRLLRNLIQNALRHGKPPVRVQVARRGADAVLSVCDDGPGVPEPDRSRVFEPFYRPSGHGESAGGWGLGLALVRQIAVHHGGDAHVDPAPGGARFVVVLPVTEDGKDRSGNPGAD